MTPILAIAVGSLFAAGIYMMLRRSAMKLVIGWCSSVAANLWFGSSDRAGGSPLTRVGRRRLTRPFTDPLPWPDRRRS